MRVVVIDGDVSYPATSGKRIRTLNLMLQLAAHHKITYLARADFNDANTKVATEFLEDHGIRARMVHDPLAAKRGASFYVRLGMNLTSRLPYSVASHCSLRMRAEVNRLAAEDTVDLWQCEWTGYLPTLSDQPIQRCLCMAHNVDTLIWRRYLEVERNAIKRVYIREQLRKFVRFERAAYHVAGRVVAVSDNDARILRDQFGVPAVDVVDNGIDCQWVSQASGTRRPQQYLFLGALDWRPNQDAVRWLFEEIAPRLFRQCPDSKLLIVGRNPPGWMVSRARATSGVELRADVPDVRPYLAESQVMVVPLRVGGGSRLKILEALAAGLPVVSTGVGVEGLRLTRGSHYLQADTAAEFAASVKQCFDDSVWALNLAQNGQRVVQREYDWAILAQKLDRVWNSCLERGPSETSGGIPQPRDSAMKL